MSSDYKIWKTDNSSSYTVPEYTTTKETPITFIGHSAPTYGQEQNTNFLHLLENFANEKEPENPVKGQLCFKKTPTDDDKLAYELKVCVDDNPSSIRWDALNISYIGGEKPDSVRDGSIWYDNVNTKALYVRDSSIGDNGGWTKIGPEDFRHHQNSFATRTVKDTSDEVNLYTYSIDMKDIKINIKNSDHTSTGEEQDTNGSLTLYEITVMVKQKFIEPRYYNSNTSVAVIKGHIIISATKKDDNGQYNVKLLQKSKVIQSKEDYFFEDLYDYAISEKVGQSESEILVKSDIKPIKIEVNPLSDVININVIKRSGVTDGAWYVTGFNIRRTQI